MSRRQTSGVRGVGLLFALALLAAATAGAQPPPPDAKAHAPGLPPTPIEHAFQRLYNFDFSGALAVLDQAAVADPTQPLCHSVRAATYLFMEMDRLKILESKFFMNDDNMVDGKTKLVPDPGVRARLFFALAEARRQASARLAQDGEDVDALFALCMSAGIETDYTALVEGRTWRSMKLAPMTLVHARKLLSRTPPCYDAYLNFGSLEYIVGDLPFFIRWFVRYDGVQGDKRRGIEQLKLTARYGRYYGPFARVLLAVVSLREKKADEAEKLLDDLAREFPENELFRKELARLANARTKKSGR